MSLEYKELLGIDGCLIEFFQQHELGQRLLEQNPAVPLEQIFDEHQFNIVEQWPNAGIRLAAGETIDWNFVKRELSHNDDVMEERRR